MLAMSPFVSPQIFLVSLLAGWLNQEQQKVLEYLQEENRVLKAQLGQRLRLSDEQRRRLAAKGKELGRKLLAEVAILVSLDFFTLPTATFRVLFVFIVLRHDRRRIVHFNVTEHPSAEWTAQQVVDAFPWDTAPRYLVRDRDQLYGAYFDTRVAGLGMEQVLTAPRSPWQNPLVERMIGSIRRECLDHVIVLDERHLRRILQIRRLLSFVPDSLVA